MLSQLTDLIGAAGLAKATEELDKLLKAADTPLKKLALSVVADAVTKFGPAGVEKAKEVLDSLLNGKQTLNVDFMDIATASDLWATFQNAEADRKSEVNAFIGVATETIGNVLGGMLKGLLAAAI
jgi:hypothetical protein